MTFIEFIEALIGGELPWEVWLWEMPTSIEQRTHGPFYYAVVSRHRSQIAAINAKNGQSPAPFNHWYRVVDRRTAHLKDAWMERI